MATRCVFGTKFQTLYYGTDIWYLLNITIVFNSCMKKKSQTWAFGGVVRCCSSRDAWWRRQRTPCSAARVCRVMLYAHSHQVCVASCVRAQQREEEEEANTLLTSQFAVAVHRVNVSGQLLLRISDRRGGHRRCGGWGEFAEGQVRYEKEAAMLKSPRSSDFI